MSLAAGSTVKVEVSLSGIGLRGRMEDRIEMIFEDSHMKKRFPITRLISATIGSQEDYKALRPQTPYIRPKRKAFEEISETVRVPGVLPSSVTDIKWAVRLPEFKMPTALRTMAFGDGTIKEIVSNVQAVLPNQLDCNTYGRQFGNLLWIEEERARYFEFHSLFLTFKCQCHRRDLQLYDIDNAAMKPLQRTRFYEYVRII